MTQIFFGRWELDFYIYKKNKHFLFHVRWILCILCNLLSKKNQSFNFPDFNIVEASSFNNVVLPVHNTLGEIMLKIPKYFVEKWKESCWVSHLQQKNLFQIGKKCANRFILYVLTKLKEELKKISENPTTANPNSG